jgi:hypothetical protein
MRSNDNSCWPAIWLPARNHLGSVFGEGSEETGTSRLPRLSLPDSIKEISNARCYELQCQSSIGART